MRPNILLVDDHQDIIRFLKELLDSENNVLVAENGQIALDILKSETVHVVISDVMMPVMDGFALCEIIKADCALSHIPVILLTGKNYLSSLKLKAWNWELTYILKSHFRPGIARADFKSFKQPL
jgi:CheY-like chemotaxis protein